MSKEKMELGAYGFHKKGTASGGGFRNGKFEHTNGSNPKAKSKALEKAKEGGHKRSPAGEAMYTGNWKKFFGGLTK